MPTYLDKPSHDAYEIAQPEGKLDAEKDGIGRRDSPANGWLFKPREDPRALFIRPTSASGKEGLSGISLAMYGNGKASSQLYPQMAGIICKETIRRWIG